MGGELVEREVEVRPVVADMTAALSLPLFADMTAALRLLLFSVPSTSLAKRAGGLILRLLLFVDDDISDE
jgi:hypothetical protein